MGHRRRRVTFPKLYYGDGSIPSKSGYDYSPTYNSDLDHINDYFDYMGRRRGKVARAYRAHLRARAEELVGAHWPEIQSVAMGLLKQKTMNEDEVRRVMGS